MQIKTLQLEILEAERLIERNKLILSLNDQLVATQKELSAASEKLAAQEAACLNTEPAQ